MFLSDDQKHNRNGKIYRRVLLRNSYRFKGKVHHATIANLSLCSDEEIKALKHKENLKSLIDTQQRVKTRQGLSVGAVWVLNQLAKQLRISKVLGQSREAKHTLWMFFSSVIEQGYRLSATCMAKRHAACDIGQISYQTIPEPR